jgi:type IX secretion system PorP/SprF family membrane protein
MRKIIFILVLFPLMGLGQDIHFSQFYLAPLQLNPATAGGLANTQASLNYKTQWSSVADAYQTYSGAFDLAITKDKTKKKGFWGLGTFIYNDKAGDAKMGTLQANVMGTYHLNLSEKSTLGLGGMYGFVQRSMNFAPLKWESQYVNGAYNASNPSGEAAGGSSFIAHDVAAGLFWRYNKGDMYMTANNHVLIEAGVSAFHLVPMPHAFAGGGTMLYQKYLGHVNMSYGIKNTRLAIQPAGLLMIQGPQTELTLGTNVRYMIQDAANFTGFVQSSSAYLGLFYRNLDAVIATAMFEKGSYAVGVSYDINVSKLTVASAARGGFEIHFRYRNPIGYVFKPSSSF